jgi:hypothetical protein
MMWAISAPIGVKKLLSGYDLVYFLLPISFGVLPSEATSGVGIYIAAADAAKTHGVAGQKLPPI